MERLTTKTSIMGRKHDLAFGLAFFWRKKLKNLRYDLIENAVDKLGAYEDLEKEIGCPFEIIVKAIKKGEVYIDNAYNCDVGEIYKIDNKEFVNLSYVKSEHIDNEEYKDTWCFEFEEVFDDFYKNPDTFIVKASNYQKTWWLKADRSE